MEGNREKGREIDGREKEGGRNGWSEVEIERDTGRKGEERDRRECEKERLSEGKRKRDIGNEDRQREEGRGR